MSCIRTGFHAHVLPYNEWVIGDAFKFGDAYIFRIAGRSFQPMRPLVNFRISNFSCWFDESDTSMERNSTMICHSNFVSHYEPYAGIKPEDM